MKKYIITSLISCVLVLSPGFVTFCVAQHSFPDDKITPGYNSKENNREINTKDNSSQKSSIPVTPPETALQRQERQVKEIAERKWQNRTKEQILHSWIVGEKAQRAIFEQEALYEIIERDRIQQEKDLEAERIRVEQDRINREKKIQERRDNWHGGRN